MKQDHINIYPHKPLPKHKKIFVQEKELLMPYVKCPNILFRSEYADDNIA